MGTSQVVEDCRQRPCVQDANVATTGTERSNSSSIRSAAVPSPTRQSPADDCHADCQPVSRACCSAKGGTWAGPPVRCTAAVSSYLHHPGASPSSCLLVMSK